MKGIVFTEFLDLVEAKFGYEVVDHIIQESKLPNEGAYTGVGTYPHGEMVALGKQPGILAEDLSNLRAEEATAADRTQPQQDLAVAAG